MNKKLNTPNEPPSSKFVEPIARPAGSGKGIRGKIKKKVLEAVDKRWFGLNPLQVHIVVCGFPRSGSPLFGE